MGFLRDHYLRKSFLWAGGRLAILSPTLVDGQLVDIGRIEYWNESLQAP